MQGSKQAAHRESILLKLIFEFCTLQYCSTLSGAACEACCAVHLYTNIRFPCIHSLQLTCWIPRSYRSNQAHNSFQDCNLTGSIHIPYAESFSILIIQLYGLHYKIFCTCGRNVVGLFAQPNSAMHNICINKSLTPKYACFFPKILWKIKSFQTVWCWPAFCHALWRTCTML